MHAVRTLSRVERVKYREHLLRLLPEHRRLRFGAFVADARIVEFADGIDLNKTHILGHFGLDLELVAAVHIEIIGSKAVELAFSVDAPFRRCGIGRALMDRALLWARNRGYSRVHVHCLTENIAMRRLARSAGIALTTEAGESDALIELQSATPLSLLAESLSEAAGLIDTSKKTNRLVLRRLQAPAFRYA